ncbi:MAG: PIN domain-containing protein [Planctomycetaceae bacterium]|jgi:predicted nucleic acid-binding protein|nr:PIN domain-containing protein [Planctomycetaceae bacterium]
MGLIDVLFNKKVLLDSAPLIYYVAEVAPYVDLLEPIFVGIDTSKIQATIATITFAEVLVTPLQKRDQETLDRFELLLESELTGIQVHNLDTEIAKLAARIRAKYKLKTPDAVQWATFDICNADYFLTNDKQLKKLDEKRVILLEEYA